MLVCNHCFAIESPRLVEEIKKHGTPGDCPTCETPDTVVIEARHLEPLFAGLRNFYEPALDGDHYRSYRDEGETIVIGDTGELLTHCLQDWPIFNDELDGATVESILDEVWPDHETGGMYTSERPWERSPTGEWEQIKEYVKHSRRFFQEYDPADFLSLEELLEEYFVDLADGLTDLDWYRARIPQPGKPPFTVAEMGPPPRDGAKAGRANPAGIPYLYLASDAMTAVAEVRAEPGYFVTVAHVRLPAGLRVLNLTHELPPIPDPFDYPKLRAEINARQLRKSFREDLSQPVLAETCDIEYVATQYLSEYFASRGFDGILYPSSMTEGRNLVLFDVRKAENVSVQSYYVTRKALTIQKLEPLISD